MYDYPESKAIKQWEKDGVSFSIILDRHHCGYCRFPERPTAEEGYNGILTYAPVHGGLTYAEQDEDGSMVYGFDCAHSGDDSRPELRDLDWLTAECEKMATAIKAAVSVEEGYLLSETEEEKAVVISSYHEALGQEGIDFELTDNFGAMINSMFGGL